ncbi:MAG: integrase core domain-containing protein [Myxococcales bacterium]|nr:integrase core domain-containing protein [Myxococcales bacterium]
MTSIVGSMGRKGDSRDNAVAEILFSCLEFECRRRHNFADLDDAQHVIGEHIDGFYNPERLHSTINYSSPWSSKSLPL